MFRKLTKKIHSSTRRGFTLAEMTIVAAIFGILTAVVVFKYGDFTSNLLVSNMAYEIALTVRQAQVFGVGVRGAVDGEGVSFDYPYGVYFNLLDGSSGGVGESRNFILFVDRDNDWYCSLNSTGNNPCICQQGDECLDQLTLQRNIRMTELRVGNEQCANIGQIASVAISFKRPSPEARIGIQNTRDNNGGQGYGFTQIKVEAPNSGINPSYVLIRKTGQISVSQDDICIRS